MLLCVCPPIPVLRSSVAPSHQWSSSAEDVASRRVASAPRGASVVAPRGGASLLAVNHPRDAKSIDNHAKARRPERLLDRHMHLTAFRQFLKDAFCFRSVF